MGGAVYFTGGSNQFFANQENLGNEVHFWAPGYQETGDINVFILTIYNTLPEFGLRQIATTAPIPGAVWLLGSGLAGLLGWWRLRKG